VRRKTDWLWVIVVAAFVAHVVLSWRHDQVIEDRLTKALDTSGDAADSLQNELRVRADRDSADKRLIATALDRAAAALEIVAAQRAAETARRK
jgi:hypothetical protein